MTIAATTYPMVPFAAACKDSASGQPKVQNRAYLDAGRYPIVDQGQQPVAGYTDDTSFLYSGELPVVLFGDHTRIFKYVDHPFALGADGVKVLSAKKGFTPKFLYYYFQCQDLPSRGYSRHFQFLKQIAVCGPPPPEQCRIVEMLDRADALRKKRAETDKIADRILPALFYKMFGDPATNPKGWDACTLVDAGAEIRYGLGQPPSLQEEGLPLIRATNIDRGSISEKGMVYVDPSAVPQSRNAELRAEEVIVVRSGVHTGDVAQVTETWKGAIAGYDLVVTPGVRLSGEFIESYLLTPFIQRGHFANLKVRGAQAHLNSTQLGATPIIVPDAGLLSAFSRDVQNWRRTREQRSSTRRSLETLFSVLLHRAFSGDLTAKWREAHMTELLQEMELQAKELELGKAEA